MQSRPNNKLRLQVIAVMEPLRSVPKANSDGSDGYLLDERLDFSEVSGLPGQPAIGRLDSAF